MLEWLALVLLVSLMLASMVALFGFVGCQLVFPAEDPEFEEAFQVTFGDEEQNLPNCCLVLRIEGNRLSKSGGQVRLVLQPPRNGNLDILDLYISHAADTAGADPYDAPAKPTKVISDRVLSPDPADELVKLDPVPFTLDKSRPLLIAMNIGDSGRIRRISNFPPDFAKSFRGDNLGSEAEEDDRSPGYDERNRYYLIHRIDVA